MTKQFRYVIVNTNEIKINIDTDEEWFDVPILWNREGMYGLISVAYLRNLRDAIIDSNKHYSEKERKVHFAVIHWPWTYKLNEKAAKLLLGE